MDLRGFYLPYKEKIWSYFYELWNHIKLIENEMMNIKTGLREEANESIKFIYFFSTSCLLSPSFSLLLSPSLSFMHVSKERKFNLRLHILPIW